MRLYVRALSDDTQIYEHSIESSPPSGYASTMSRSELEGGTFYASRTMQEGMVPVYRFAIASSDQTPVYYLSTRPETPPSFGDRRVQFFAYDAPRPGTRPVFLYTIRDSHNTQVYYYSTSSETPPSFNAGGAVFHVFADPPPRWSRTANVAAYWNVAEGAGWGGLLRIERGLTVEQAMQRAMADPAVTHYFVTTGAQMVLEAGREDRTFRQGDTAFFSGQPWWGGAPGLADGYVRQPAPPR